MTGTSQTLFAPRGQPQSRVESLPFISVIVPVRNEAAFIGRTLDQLLGQNYEADRFEVIVADGLAAARASSLGHHPGSYIYSTEEQFVPPHSVAIAYRRSVFERVGLFDEKFDACEDVEFNHRVHRARCRCFFTPAVRVRYHPRTTF